LRNRARAHFAPSARRAAGTGAAVPVDWPSQVAIVDYRATCSELGALVLENRLIKELRPPGNVRLAHRDDRLVYIRCRLDIPYPILEVAREPAAGHAVTIGPLRGRRLAVILARLEGVLEATHARPRLIIAAHPTGRSGDAFWVVGGRVVDWGPVPGTLEELEQRTHAALARGGRAGELGAHVPPHEVDEVRIVATYLASHTDLRQLVLEPPPPGDVLGAFAQPANGSSTTSALTGSSPTSTD